MFQQFCTQHSTIARHHTSPYAVERRRYLSHLMEEGRSRNSLRLIAELLISYAQHLPLHRAEVRPSDIQIPEEAWAKTRRGLYRVFVPERGSLSFTLRSGCICSDDYTNRKKITPLPWNEWLSFGFSGSKEG